MTVPTTRSLLRRGRRLAVFTAGVLVAALPCDAGAFTGDYTELSGGNIPAFYVSIAGRAPDGKTWTCSGVLTTARTVATAAHCLTVEKNRAEPLAGAVFTVSRGLSGASVEAYAPEVISPPSRTDIVDATADVGRLFLREPLAGARPLPVLRERKMEEVLNKDVRLYGTGDTPTGPAKAVNLLTARTRARASAPRHTYSAIHDNPQLHHACSGDSGGPVVLQANGKDVLAGIIISGPDDACVARPAQGRTTIGVVARFRLVLEEQPRD